jgi:S-adenosylmethionine:tRNA ribosyltransferase-isomerase
LQVSDFDYELPHELIAQEPLPERGASRMLVVSRSRQTFEDDRFENFSRYIQAGDCLVLNNSRVFPARLHGRRNTPQAAAVEVLLIRALNPDSTLWEALVKPAKRVKTGDEILFGDELRACVVSQGEFGQRTLRFEASQLILDLIDRLGETPLPPYIHRQAAAIDRERYQTVFAERRGSAAAPTAGLHFTPEMLDKCRAAGAEIASVTLHVGLGTFAPLRENDLARIRLHREHFEIDETNAATLRQAKRLVCIGTTSVRVIETALARGGLYKTSGETDLFIHPGFEFHGTGAMLTNFHLPQSSLLMLVCAFAGRELALAAYRHAVAEKYRFFSYGDCMLIE